MLFVLTDAMISSIVNTKKRGTRDLRSPGRETAYELRRRKILECGD